MPIEIKELHIRVAVTSSATPAAATGGKVTADDRDAIVADCIEQVLSILQNKAER